MRYTVHALIGVFLIGSCLGHGAHAESGSRWWPFGSSGDAEESQPPTAESSRTSTPRVGSQSITPEASPGEAIEQPVEEPPQNWMIDSPRAKVSWPRLQMPEFAKPDFSGTRFRSQESEGDPQRNSWAEQDPAAKKRSTWQAMSGGARRVGKGTRAAWDKTVDVLTPGDGSSESSSRVARREDRPPWWKRMFTVEDREPQGPRTVTEWMAQERVDP